jgi:hypothetical protein
MGNAAAPSCALRTRLARGRCASLKASQDIDLARLDEGGAVAVAVPPRRPDEAFVKTRPVQAFWRQWREGIGRVTDECGPILALLAISLITVATTLAHRG